MGGQPSKKVDTAKEENDGDHNEENGGFHFFEVHAPSAGVGGLLLFAIIGVCITLYVFRKRLRARREKKVVKRAEERMELMRKERDLEAATAKAANAAHAPAALPEPIPAKSPFAMLHPVGGHPFAPNSLAFGYHNGSFFAPAARLHAYDCHRFEDVTDYDYNFDHPAAPAAPIIRAQNHGRGQAIIPRAAAGIHQPAVRFANGLPQRHHDVHHAHRAAVPDAALDAAAAAVAPPPHDAALPAAAV